MRPALGSTPEVPTLFQAALGNRWHQLPACIRRLHSVRHVESFSGQARVTRGSGLMAALAGWLFGFPRAGDGVPLTLTITSTAAGEIWERNFGGQHLRSILMPSRRPFHYRERFGPFTYEQELPVEDGVLRLPVRRGWFFGLPLPSPLLARSCSSEFAQNGMFHFDIGIYAPFTGGLIIRYQGHLRPDAL
jgi:Domain of unknown function (DUF4166)